MDYKKYPGKELKIYGEYTNKEKPTISIITPFYNGGEFLEETYNAVMNQTYPYFEWIIVDDGSKDEESIEKLAEIAKRDNRIKTYRKENEGPSLARDYAISKASKETKYLYSLDCDDVINPTILECLYWALETHPDASFAYTTIVNFGAEEYTWEKYLTVEREKVENLINGNALMKKTDVLEVGCYGIKEKSMYEDWNLWLKLIRAGKKPLRVNAPIFWYRRQVNSELSRANNNKTGAMKYVNETASTISDDQVEVIQYPRYGDEFATIKEYDMVLPDYKKDSRTTILFIFPWMTIGGADLFNLYLLQRLPKDKYRSIVLTTIPNSNPLRQEFEEYAEVYDMTTFIDRINYQAFADYIMSSRKVDLVFVSNSEYGYYMIPYLKSKHPKVPFIDYIHAIDLKEKRGSFGRCSKDTQAYLYKTYVCNGFTKKQLKEKYDISSEVVYIGTDENRFDSSKYDKEELLDKYDLPRDKKIITYIARLSEEKRPEMFVDIGKKVHEKDPNTFFVIAGDGPLTKQVKNKINKNFKMLGMIKKPEEVYAISDITVNCSRSEGLAFTSYESLSMKVPVVSAEVGGQAELIDDSVGGTIPYLMNGTKEEYDQEVNNYRDKIIKVLNNLEETKKNCREKVLNGFTLDIMAQKMEKIFMDAIKESNNDVVDPVNNSIYELSCETSYDLYTKFTNAYYLDNLGVNLKEEKTRFTKIYHKIMDFLYRIGANKQGKTIKDFLSAFVTFIKSLIKMLIHLVLAIPAFIILVWKILVRVIRKIIRKIIRK